MFNNAVYRAIIDWMCVYIRLCMSFDAWILSQRTSWNLKVECNGYLKMDFHWKVPEKQDLYWLYTDCTRIHRGKEGFGNYIYRPIFKLVFLFVNSQSEYSPKPVPHDRMTRISFARTCVLPACDSFFVRSKWIIGGRPEKLVLGRWRSIKDIRGQVNRV